VEEATRRNLKELGFPLSEKEDRILSKDERTEWTSDKVKRRAHVAADYRIIMLFGDDLNDFIAAKGISQKKRAELVRKYMDMWGTKWFILPNPTYGSWESALYDFENNLDSSEINRRKVDKLDTRQKE